MNLARRHVVVLGLGSSGRSAASVAVARGAVVVGVDSRTDVPPLPGVRIEAGETRAATFAAADLVVISPGVPPGHGGVRAAEAAGVPVVGELGFARWYLPQPCVAITGTNGKSTVTTFVGSLLAASGRQPFVGGNLGPALSDAVDGDADVLVVEVSSYQLERPGGFRPDVGVVLNLARDHLARHGDMASYARTKLTLFQEMGPSDLAVLPRGSEMLDALCPPTGRRAWLGGHPGVTREGDIALVRLGDGHEISFDLSDFQVPGTHNRDNLATALLLAVAAGASPRRLQGAIAGLRGLPHRSDLVGVMDQVTWIDDSKATNVAATAAALAGMNRPTVLLLGGESKAGDDFGALAPLVHGHRAILTFGADGTAIASALSSVGARFVGSLAEAVTEARRLARAGDVVLLSPGCASFDAFTDFSHRGRSFRALAIPSSEDS